jgi:hypothetical protein
MKQFLIALVLLVVAYAAPASAQVLYGPGGIYPGRDVFLESGFGCDLMMGQRGLYCRMNVIILEIYYVRGTTSENDTWNRSRSFAGD